MVVMISSWVMPRQRSAPLRSLRRNMLSPMPVQRPLSTHGSLSRIAGSKELLADLVDISSRSDGDDLVERSLARGQVVVNAKRRAGGCMPSRGAGTCGWPLRRRPGASRRVGIEELRPTMHSKWLDVLSRPKPRTQNDEESTPILNVRALRGLRLLWDSDPARAVATPMIGTTIASLSVAGRPRDWGSKAT